MAANVDEDAGERTQLAFTLGPWSGNINAHRSAFKDVPETCPKVEAVFNDLVSGMMQVFGAGNLDGEQWQKIIDLKDAAEVQIKELTMALRGALIRAHDCRISMQKKNEIADQKLTDFAAQDKRKMERALLGLPPEACSVKTDRVEQPHGPDHTTA